MFIIERAVSNYESAMDRWERDREKWKETHDYYSNSDYEESHPKPLNWVKVVARSFVIGVCIALVAILVIGFAKEVARDQKNKPKEAAAQTEGKNCQSFNKDDYVRIQYGDYVNVNGHIIGGCEAGQDYQVKLDAGSWANPSDNNSEPVDVGGRTISVDDKDNLVVVEKK